METHHVGGLRIISGGHLQLRGERWPGLKPRSIRFNSIRLRISRPAASASTTDEASCRTTRTRRASCRDRPAVPLRPPSFNTAVTSGRDNCSAGSKPNRMPVTTASSAVNPSTLPSSVVSSMRGRFAGRIVITICSPAHATAIPATRAGHGQHHAFGEQLADDVCAIGAQRRPQGDFRRRTSARAS